MYVCMYVYIHIYIYTYTHTHTVSYRSGCDPSSRKLGRFRMLTPTALGEGAGELAEYRRCLSQR